MSERVVAPPAAVAATAPAPPLLQRKCACGTHTPGGAECGECARQRTVGTCADTAILPADPGQPLGAATRAAMEPAFGRDFSRVRIHTGSNAARAAQNVGAAAYTAGEHIVFGAGHYAPHTARGAHVLAHELAHVAQREGNASTLSGSPSFAEASDPAEREAEHAAGRVLRGERARMTQVRTARIHRLGTGEIAGITAGAVAGAGLLGLGIAWLAGAFDRSVFSPTELNQYLDLLARTRHIEDHRDSDNKARDLVRRWRAGDAAFDLDAGHRTAGGSLTGVELKRLLIREMMSGVCGDDDERAILDILENSSTAALTALLDPALGLSVQDIDDKVGGDNHARFERLLEERMPRRGPDAAPQRQGTGQTCTARQSLMLDYARRTAVEMVDHAIRLLSSEADSPAVRHAVECRFRGATAAQLAQVRGVFERVRAALPQRIYHCGAEGGQAELEGMRVRDSNGETLTIPCTTELAVTFGQNAGTSRATTVREVFLCADFFRQNPTNQAITVVHESVHMAGLLDDIQYQPGCGMNLSDALRNPDSYAYFANDLMGPRPGEAGFTLPHITVGNFRNQGALSEENHCPICADLPGLGLDPSTGQNIMELRGEIDEHRRGVEYDFKRTKERAIWRRAGEQWELLQYDPRGTDDDRTSSDESLVPVNNHIYAVDGPGLQDLSNPGPGAHAADEFVYKASFVESVNARAPNGAWAPASNQFQWHSITWLEKVNGAWRRKTGENEVEPGAITIGTLSPRGPDDNVPVAPPGTAYA